MRQTALPWEFTKLMFVSRILELQALFIPAAQSVQLYIPSPLYQLSQLCRSWKEAGSVSFLLVGAETLRLNNLFYFDGF